MKPIAPVLRTKDQARLFYDRISAFYDWLTASEKPLVKQGIEILCPQPGEWILEIGCGTGAGLALIREKVGPSGFSLGLDLSYRMLLESRKKLCSGLVQGDAAHLPLSSGCFDGLFCSFTLELFPQTQILLVLSEIRRVLKPDGRLVVIALSSHHENLALSLYETAHRLFPVAVDCRPIPLEQILLDSNFRIQTAAEYMNWGLPMKMVECGPV